MALRILKKKLYNNLLIIAITALCVLLLTALHSRFDFAVIEDDADECYQKRSDDYYFNIDDAVLNKTLNALNNSNLLALIAASVLIFRLICQNNKPYYFYIELRNFFRPPPRVN